MQRNILILSVLIFLLASPFSLKGQENKFTLTFNMGHSFGLSNSYRLHVEPGGEKSQYKLGFNSGLGFQYYFSNRLGFQLEAEFQKQYFHRNASVRSESFGNILLNVILLLNNPQKNKPSFYLFGGAGLGGERMLGRLVRMGGGVKYKFLKNEFLNLRLPFTYEVGEEFNLFNPSYVSINIGFEWEF